MTPSLVYPGSLPVPPIIAAAERTFSLTARGQARAVQNTLSLQATAASCLKAPLQRNASKGSADFRLRRRRRRSPADSCKLLFSLPSPCACTQRRIQLSNPSLLSPGSRPAKAAVVTTALVRHSVVHRAAAASQLSLEASAGHQAGSDVLLPQAANLQAGSTDSRLRVYPDPILLPEAGTDTPVPHGVLHSSLRVVEAECVGDLFSCAWLRALCFITCNRVCAPEILQRQRLLRAEEESAILEQKIKGKLPGFPRTACLLAAAPLSKEAFVAPEDLALVLSFPELPVGPTSGTTLGLTVGTLDLNLGLRLAGEELAGNWPEVRSSTGGEEQWQRGYISNVCVAPAWRNRGIAAQLLQSVQQLAATWGVLHLYIHVEADNLKARRVYERAGYTLEKRETAATARFFSRKPRLLLHKPLHAGEKG